MSNLLGALKTGQRSLDTNVNVNQINNLLLSNIDKFKIFVKKTEDIYAKELLNSFEKNKEFKFPINKHVELFILKNNLNIEKIFNYLVFRYKFYLAGKNKINLGYPPYLLIEPVSACNLRCPFCFQTDKSFTRKPYMGVMDFDFFKNIVDQADDLKIGAITLASRGEPTMHKKFIEMLEYINKKKNIFEIKVNTNASFLTEKICFGILQNNITQIVISSDHYLKEDYEKLRLGSNFEKIVQNVDNLFNIRQKYFPDSITEIRVSGIDNDRNLDRIKFKEFWIKRSDHVTAGYPLERWDTYKNEVMDDLKEPCEFLWDRMYVWFDGKVNPCDADYKSYLSFGNAKKYSLKNLWNNKAIEKTRNHHKNKNRNKINPCDRCGVKFE